MHHSYSCAVLDAVLCGWLQLEAAQRRVEAAAATLQEERSAHRRALRHKNRELAEAQVRQLRRISFKAGTCTSKCACLCSTNHESRWELRDAVQKLRMAHCMLLRAAWRTKGEY